MNVRKWRWLVIQFVLGAVVLAACGAIVARTVFRSDALNETTGKPVSLAVDGRTAATLNVLSSTNALTIQMANLGPAGKLVEVTMTSSNKEARLKLADGGAKPGGAVDLSANLADALTVTLNSSVRWTLALSGGSTTTVADLSAGQVAGIAFTKNGSDTVALTLAKPAGSVPIRFAAGATQVQLSVPDGVPVRVTAAAGAGQISLEGQTHQSVKKGTVLTTQGWSAGAAGFDIDAVAGAAKLTVTARSS